MRFIVLIMLIPALFITSCVNKGMLISNDTRQENVSDKAIVDNDSEDDQTIDASPQTTPIIPETVAADPYALHEMSNGEEGMTPLDFESAYQLCNDAISDYFTAYDENNFEQYFENDKLEEYIARSVEWGKPDRTIRRIGLSTSEFHNLETDDIKWFFFNAFVEFVDGGLTVEIIVKESADGGSLVIADWYVLSKQYMDDQIRSHYDAVDDPDIWEDATFADEMLVKAQAMMN
ncbi:MAG: hypothetical protein LBV33_00470 [Lachnospiraceae bacterium]|nr:hypothetical protein [Lachnospiraceae bacterium]